MTDSVRNAISPPRIVLSGWSVPRSPAVSGAVANPVATPARSDTVARARMAFAGPLSLCTS